MTGMMCALVGATRNTILDTQTVTVGTFSTSGGFGTGYGFLSANGGSVSDGTFNPKAGAAITALYCNVVSGANTIIFSLGTSQTNADWNTVVINGVSYDRASASYSSGVPTSWTWVSATNPFGTTNGALITATFS